MEIFKTTLDSIKNLRTDYLNSLSEFQELFLELMIPESDCYALEINDVEIGYLIRNKDGALIEFYIEDRYIPQTNEFFEQIIRELSMTEIYCKSFDFLLLNNCLVKTYPYSILGVLYRDYVEPSLVMDSEIKMIKADLTSTQLLMDQDDSIKELF